jgi:dihydrofolate synthase/folylpolyglutamate synthase
MDHMQYLGDTLAKIAGEKAAIMKSGVTCVSVAQKQDAADVIAAAAAEIGAIVKTQNLHWKIEEQGDGLLFTGERNVWKVPLPSLPGRHQFENAGLALAALEQSPFAIPFFALRSGFRNVSWPARAQKLKEGPLVVLLPPRWELWLDGGHNAGGGAAIAALAADEWGDAPLHLVCGMLTTKAAEDYLRPLAAHAASFTAVPIPGNDTAFTPAELAAAAKAAGHKHVNISDDVEAALKAISPEGRARVLICGSLYLAGEVLKANG